MGIPPTRSSSTPPSKGRSDETRESSDKREKEFKLPARKQSVESKEEEQSSKKKGLFDIAAAMDMTVHAKQQEVSEMDAAAVKTSGVTAADAAQQVGRISQLIQRTVESMQIGQINQQTYAKLQLKASGEVPASFAGSNLTLSYQQNGLSIHFDNFMTTQDQNKAITLVEQHKEQLQQMIQALSSKNIQVTELMIGAHTVALPKVQPLPPPFQVSSPTAPETEQQGQHDRGGEGDEESGR